MTARALAQEFLHAYNRGTVIPEPPSVRDEDFTMDEAYEVEAEFRHLREELGHRFVGRKVGYANKAIWRALKMETLVWASMYDDTVVEVGKHGMLDLRHIIQPKIEPEIVFKLNSSSGPEWMAIGFEIIDCPFPNWKFKPEDFVAAWGLHRYLAVGEPAPVDSAALEQLATFTLRLFRNGELVAEGAGRNSLKSPALCLAELAKNASLSPGEFISTGTLVDAPFVSAGETWKVEVSGLAVSNLTVEFPAASA